MSIQKSVTNERLKEVADGYHIARSPRTRELPPVCSLSVAEIQAMARELLEARAEIRQYEAEEYDRQMGADA